MFRLFSGAFIFLVGFIMFNSVNGVPVASFISVHGILLAFFMIMSGFVASKWTVADLASVLNGRAENEKHALRLTEMLSFFEKVSVISSVIGLAAGAVILLSHLGAASRIGPALAVTLLMPFYCMVFYMFAAVLKSRIKLTAGAVQAD
jgi:hypothetical protein